MIRAVLFALVVALGATTARAAEKAAEFMAGDLVIAAPWTRATPAGSKVAGGFMTITNKGAEADRLIGGTLVGAGVVEIHEMSMKDGVMVMRALADGLEIKPGETVTLQPGGYHIMFIALAEGLKEGAVMDGTLVFQRAGTVAVSYPVAALGTRDPHSGSHAGSDAGSHSGSHSGADEKRGSH